MKTYKNLYPDLASFGNLYVAFMGAARGTLAPALRSGASAGERGNPEVAAFEFDLEANLFQLESELCERTYRPKPYYSFRIRDPKSRLISAARFRDRVVHHALVQFVEPIFERGFIYDSYANRRGKGTHRALDRCQSFARGYRYVLQCDLRQFFPSVDHAILREILARKIADPGVTWLAGCILESGAGVLDDEYDMVYFPADYPFSGLGVSDRPNGSGQGLFAVNRPRGLPIGNLTSQFWANCYLNPLDHFIKRELHCRAYLRYVDDFVLFSDCKRQLWECKRAIHDFLARLRLSLHERESTVYPVTNGIPFLGFRVYPTHRRLKRRNGVAFARRLRAGCAALARGEITQQELNQRVRGWVAHAAHGDTYRLRQSLFSSMRIPRSKG